MTAKRAAIVINPSKSTDVDFRAVLETQSKENGWAEPLWLETTVDDPGVGMAREALKAGVDVVLAAGGDGTVRCVAEVLAGTGIAMTVIPLGTGNLLARNLGINLADPEGAVRSAFGSTERSIDAVEIVLDHSQDKQIYAVMAGLGFDATIMADTDSDLKDKVGFLAYVDAGLRNLQGEPVKAKIHIDGGHTIRRRVRSVMGGNCGRVQGGLEVFPGAKIDDGVLDLMVMAPSGAFGWVAVVAGIAGRIFGRSRAANPAVEYYTGTRVEIEVEKPQDIQLDGDHVGEASHVQMTLLPNALKIRGEFS
ncbi:diacylglycerol/lipid kinase family protein [Pseudarthrobacter sp. J1763]|uniref:diacylglycerol/lipid kinase family protein n=1 Tax=Pseudarthrobacter sp. J1763 TaxID=3420445 RepID=UPI003D27D3AC